MSKIAQIINEKMEKLDPKKVLTDLTNNKDKKIIADFVNSKKKDERIAIAANSNLTKEQQTKLSGDRVNAVKQALCYNANLDIDLAKKLLEEEPERIDIIAKYGNSHLDMLAFEEAAKKDTEWSQRFVIEKLVQSPEISDEAVEKITKEYPDVLDGTASRLLLKNQKLSKKAVYILLDHLSKAPSNGDAPLMRLIANQQKYIKEADIKKLDWKNNPQVQSAVIIRDDLSEGFTSDVIENLNEKTSLGLTFQRTVNKHMFTSTKVVNNLMTRLLTFKISYNHDFNYFEKSKQLPLDPRLMVDLVKHLQNSSMGEQGIRNILRNKFFPSYGIDEIDVNEKNFDKVLASPSVDDDKADMIINKFLINSKFAEKAVFGLADARIKRTLKDETYNKLLEMMETKSYWFEFAISGKKADEVIKDFKKYGAYFVTEWNDKPIFIMLLSLSKNRYLSPAQKKKIIDIQNNLPANQIGYGDLKTHMVTSDKNPDPKFFEELVTTLGGSVWDIWLNSGSAYFQYEKKFRKTIDKIALKEKDIPGRVLSNMRKDFSDWVTYNNSDYGDGDTSEKMSKAVAEQYLIHFIKNGDDSMNELLSDGKFIDDKWLTPDVKIALYELTQDDKYLPDDAKDIFLF